MNETKETKTGSNDRIHLGPEFLKRLASEGMDAEPESPTALVGPRLVPVEELLESPTNPRKGFGELGELARSIKTHGVLQPLIARALCDGEGKPGFELVVGHRRLRAAKMAGLGSVPVDLRVLSDWEALELQLVENLQREDLQPLEESEAYERMHKELGLSTAAIAERIGKSPRWVETRIQLTRLVAEAKKALASGRINVSVALLIARVPHPKLQAEATEKLLEMSEEGEQVSVRVADEWLRTNYTLELKGAPFERKDAYLVPEAGPCTTCPKRSGNSPDLFDSLKKADICTDTVCFKSKVAAAWDQQKEKAEAKGKKVLPANVAKGLFRYGDQPTWDSKFALLDSPCTEDPKRRTWAELLDKVNEEAEEKPVVYVAQDKQGKAHDLIERAVLLELTAKSGQKWAQKAEAEQAEMAKSKNPEEQKRAQNERKVREAVVARAIGRIVDTIEQKPLGLPELRVIAKALGVATETKAILLRRGMTSERDLEAFVDRAQEKKLGALIFEEAITEWAGDTWSDYSTQLKALAKAYSVDLAELERKELLAAEAAEAFEGKKGKAKA